MNTNRNATTATTTTPAPAPRKRAKKVMENHDRYLWIRRAIVRYGEKVADGDPEDLAEMLALRADLDAAIGAAVRGQRATWGSSWAAIGTAAGMTKQAAQQRWGRTA